jgi:hypothetical protein
MSVSPGVPLQAKPRRSISAYRRRAIATHIAVTKGQTSANRCHLLDSFLSAG